MKYWFSYKDTHEIKATFYLAFKKLLARYEVIKINY